MRIEPGMLCWLGWIPPHRCDPGLADKVCQQVEIVSKHHEPERVCNGCHQYNRYWDIAAPNLPPEIVACECILTPIPPDQTEIERRCEEFYHD